MLQIDCLTVAHGCKVWFFQPRYSLGLKPDPDPKVSEPSRDHFLGRMAQGSLMENRPDKILRAGLLRDVDDFP